MNSNLILTIILVVCSVAALGSALDMPDATNYIDVGRFIDHVGSHLDKVVELIEGHGNENPEVTAGLLRDLEQTLRDNPSSVGAKFYIHDLSDGESYNLETVVSQFTALTKEIEKSCQPFVLEHFQQIINRVFGDNLHNFIEEGPKKSPRLYAYLLHFGKRTIGHCLKDAVESDFSAAFEPELQMDKMVACDEDLVAGKRDEELIGMAKQLDLLEGTFAARRMLNSVETDGTAKKAYSGIDAYQRLYRLLANNCHQFVMKFGNRFDVYNLARFLMPKEAAQLKPSTRFIKLNEYMRICLPIENTKYSDLVLKNVLHNLPTLKLRIKRIRGTH